MLAALWAWNLYNGRNIFLVALGEPQSLAVLRLPPRSVVALVTLPEVRRRLLSLPRHQRLDLATATLPISASRRVVCDHFEDDLDDPAVRQRKLEVLEELVRGRRRRVVIPSAVDPVAELLRHEGGLLRQSGGEEDGAGEQSEAGEDPAGNRAGRPEEEDEARRWGRLLGEFVVVPVRPEERAAVAEPSQDEAPSAEAPDRDSPEAETSDPEPLAAAAAPPSLRRRLSRLIGTRDPQERFRDGLGWLAPSWGPIPT